jgi:hypothetical protein
MAIRALNPQDILLLIGVHDTEGGIDDEANFGRYQALTTLSFENGQWQMKTLQPDDPLGYVLNNWWDVIMLPPQGYVKFRRWINMPDQTPVQPGNPATDFIVNDNANVFGSWVYHCHILRHEDRGMMMSGNHCWRPPARSKPHSTTQPSIRT